MVAVGAATVAGGVALFADSGSGEPEPPNILVVTTDDQVLSSYRTDVMPATTAFFGEQGTTFAQAIATPPLCCPSRAGFLTGQYAHNHGVLGNEPGYGSLVRKRVTLATALDRAGYRTGFVGKFLSLYEADGGAQPAPGFDRWFATLGSAPYFDFDVSDDGKESSFRGARNYSTDVYARTAAKFVAAQSSRGDPFFLWLSPNAPHTVDSNRESCPGESAQARDADELTAFEGERAPRSEAFDEDPADKPPYARRKPLSEQQITALDSAWRCQLAALRAVDEGFERVIDELERTGELDNTLVAFFSDNGYFNGEHRRIIEKRLPLEPSVRVPLAIRLPEGSDQARGLGVAELVSTIDLAPTLLDYAGIEGLCESPRNCRTMDGRSLRPLLEGDIDAWPADRALPLELEDSYTYTALRTPTAMYLNLTESNGRKFEPPAIELYDLTEDPNQLENLGQSDEPATIELRETLADRLAELGRCRGIEGRDSASSKPFCE